MTDNDLRKAVVAGAALHYQRRQAKAAEQRAQAQIKANKLQAEENRLQAEENKLQAEENRLQDRVARAQLAASEAQLKVAEKQRLLADAELARMQAGADREEKARQVTDEILRFYSASKRMSEKPLKSSRLIEVVRVISDFNRRKSALTDGLIAFDDIDIRFRIGEKLDATIDIISDLIENNEAIKTVLDLVRELNEITAREEGVTMHINELKSVYDARDSELSKEIAGLEMKLSEYVDKCKQYFHLTGGS